LYVSSASAIIVDDMATVTVNSLLCEQTYSIVAGGVITDNVMMDQILDGPKFQTEIFNASSCPTTSALNGKVVIC